MLSTVDHRRDSAGLIYVYPVVSRRARGVSVGINLNPNNACNWACVYCQVDNLQRGGPPPIDLERLESELAGFLQDVLHGDFMQRQVPPEARQLMDIAFSGNGEPTSADEFELAMLRVAGCVDRAGLTGKIPVRLISNGSLMHRPAVQSGLRVLAAMQGEVWFKLDRVLADEVMQINRVPFSAERVANSLQVCSGIVSTWVQTCWFAWDGEAPMPSSRQAYCNFLKPFAARLAGIHLYGLARESKQPQARHLARLAEGELQDFAQQIQKETGIRVMVSP